ncbi:MAG: iron uptake system protein EfeO [Actinomycetes bacterium]
MVLVAVATVPLATACSVQKGEQTAQTGEQTTTAGARGAGGGAGGAAVAVTAADRTCTLSTDRIRSGTARLAITNTGVQVTEVYVYRPDKTIVTERENIGPGTSATVTVELAPGTYSVTCKPGMTGDGIASTLTVTGSDAASSASAAADPRLKSAVSGYRAYVAQEVDRTLAATQAFVAAVTAGDVARAKELYAPSRVGWERIEPVAESFGDLDPKIDAREADLGPGDTWTGWHRLEKALWQTGSVAGLSDVAAQLLADLHELEQRVGSAQLTATGIANGAKELLDEVATGKITGEEEAFSHTDLADFQANLEGARRAYQLLRPVVAEQEAALAATLDREFADVQHALDAHRTADGPTDFVSYETVAPQERKHLADAVDALAEPLSHLAAAVAR